MTVKTRLIKLENEAGAADQYIDIKPGRFMQLCVAFCVKRYRFTEDEVRERLKHETFDNLKLGPRKIKTANSKMSKEERHGRVAELLDKKCLKYFTDTANPDIPKKAMARAIEEREADSRLTPYIPKLVKLPEQELHEPIAPDKNLETSRQDQAIKQEEEEIVTPPRRHNKSRTRNLDFLRELDNW